MNQRRMDMDVSVDVGLRLRMRGEARRISAQHEELDRLRRAVCTRIEQDGALAALDTFICLAAALDAHMNLEEEIYFPALHGLSADVGAELAEMVSEHGEVRLEAVEIRKLLWNGDQRRAQLAFDGFIWRISQHEMAEERLIARVMGRPLAARCPFESNECGLSKEN